MLIRTIRSGLIPSAILVAVLLTAGCGARQVRIAELQDQPARYDNKTVRVSGTVTSSFGIPLVAIQLYNVEDGSGEISVISMSGRAPGRGTRLEVEGKLGEVAVLGGRSIGLHLREESRKRLN